MVSKIGIRSANQSDCSDLAILGDMASRRFNSYLWDLVAMAGQSSFEIGCEIIRTDRESNRYFTNWQIAELEERTIGALNAYAIPKNFRANTVSEISNRIGMQRARLMAPF